MPQASDSRVAEAHFQTSFLIPNLHCPSCVTYIKLLLESLDSRPTVKNISIIDHVVTVLHANSLPASSVASHLTSAGFEVFDIVLDPSSNEKLPPLNDGNSQLDIAVRRWDPEQQAVDTRARTLHDAHCKSCADHKITERSLGSRSVSVSESSFGIKGYVATLSIDGMTCSSCVGNVSRALSVISDVERVDVSLLTCSANVHFKAEETDVKVHQLIETVEDAGYDAKILTLRPDQSDFVQPKANGDLWKATYSIEGMSCSSCVSKVSDTLEELEFVGEVNINLVAHSGTVTFKDKDNEPRILVAIEDLGYDATRTEMTNLSKEGLEVARTVSFRIDGMHCPNCPRRIYEMIKGLSVRIDKAPSLEDPILTVTYIPKAPNMTVRILMGLLEELDESFNISFYQPPSVEERSRKMLAKEGKAIFLRAVLSVLTAIPTLVIGIVYMNLMPHDNPGYVFLMEQLRGVSRAEWATFAMATPVYFFAADHFHRRMLKEIYALWKPRSPVPILRRFYRFGSMDMLVSLGTTIAYVSSLVELIIAASDPLSSAKKISKQSYFDSVVFLTMFLLIGRLAEAHMKAKTGDAVSALGKLRPTEAILVADTTSDEPASVRKINVDLVDVGDVVRLPNGSSPPCDGILLDGNAELDESSLTGESRLVHKSKGETIFSGTINKGPAISMKVTGPAGTSMLDSIIQVVREGQAKRAPMERVADLLTAYFVPVVVAIAIFTWMIWLSLGTSGLLPKSYLDNGYGGWQLWSLQFAIAVFVIACPCGLGLAAPTALFVGGGIAASKGILAKGGGEAFQEASNLDAVVFDKTGTLTEGSQPKIVQHCLFNVDLGLEASHVMGVLRSVEESSSHPLAKAAVAFSMTQSASAIRVSGVDEIPGKGLKAAFTIPNGKQNHQAQVLVGNEVFMRDYGVLIPEIASEQLESWKSSGYSVILLACFVSSAWHLMATFAAADPIRPEAAEVVRSLQSEGIDVWMLSGDNKKTAEAVGKQVGILPQNIIAGVLPTQKAEEVKLLRDALLPRQGRGLSSFLTRSRERATIAMVGDGINDAPALAMADVGVAVASGSDVAIQSAAFVLTHEDLRAVLTLVTLSRVVFRRVVLNFFWAAVYNIVALPIAAGVLYPIVSNGRHVRLDPAWAALAMAMSSITVVGSSLLLRTGLPLVGFRDRSWAREKSEGDKDKEQRLSC